MSSSPILWEVQFRNSKLVYMVNKMLASHAHHKVFESNLIASFLSCSLGPPWNRTQTISIHWSLPKKQKRKEREIISFVYYNLQPLWLNLYFSFLLGWEWSLLPYINIGTSACNTRVIGTYDKHTLRKSCEECKKHNRNQTKWFTHGDHHRSKRLGTLFLLERNRWIIHILNTKPNLYSSRITHPWECKVTINSEIK